jgi:hypothetical protein
MIATLASWRSWVQIPARPPIFKKTPTLSVVFEFKKKDMLIRQMLAMPEG